jgi:low temperature requirement protein LtrA
MNERWPDRKAGQGKGLWGEAFSDLIFCFLIKQYGEALLSTFKNKKQRKK